MNIIRLAIILCFFAGQVLAQEACAPRMQLAFTLAAKYGEQHQFSLVSQMLLFEVWMNAGTKTWTIVKTNSEGWSCFYSIRARRDCRLGRNHKVRTVEYNE